MSRVFHTEGDSVFKNRRQIEEHLLAKVATNTAGQIGTELELFVTNPEYRPITFDQIELLLEYIAGQFPGTQLVTENRRIVGLNIPNLGDICLEPGGQVEISTKPCNNLQELQTVNEKMRAALDQAAAFFDLRVKGQGHIPAFAAAEDMPRSRFEAYYRYCRHEIGDKAEDLIKTMKSVCSLQVNFDPMGDDFYKVYQALLLADLATAFSQMSPRQECLNRTYAPFFPEQTTPVFEALKANSNVELMGFLVDRLLTIKIPFIPDQSPEGFKSSLDIFGHAPTVGELLKNGQLTTEILDNALSLQLTPPNLRRHGVLETRLADSVDTVEALMQTASLYHKVAYNAVERQKLLDCFKAIEPALLKEAYAKRGNAEDVSNTEMGAGLKVRDLVEIVSKPFAAAQKRSFPSP